MQNKFSYALGVINITPDSFSDGGEWTARRDWAATIQQWREWGLSHFDIGPQSTAPQSRPCSESEEWERLKEYFFPKLDLFKSGETISLDTYRASTFLHFYRKVSELRPDLKLVWNDVSGVLDGPLWQTLQECSKAQLVFSHAFMPEREQTPGHMDFARPELSPQSFFEQLYEHFKNAREQFLQRKMNERVIFDPGLGFSKSYEQNLFLLKRLPELLDIFEDNSWLVGISRKSFLQRLQPESLNPNEKRVASETLHSSLITQLLGHWQSSKNRRDIFIRLHDPLVFLNARTALTYNGRQ